MEKKVFHIFDLDDTLVYTPKAKDVLRVIDGKLYSGDYIINKQIKEIDECLSLWEENTFFEINGDNIILQNLSGRLKIEDIEKHISSLEPKGQKKLKDIFKAKDGKVVLKRFKAFFKSESTVGVKFKANVLNEYLKASNKMILTGRSVSLFKGVSYILFNYLNLEFPNFGLHLFNGRKTIQEFKLDVIANSIIENKWTEVHLWEDNKEWLSFIAKKISVNYPDVTFFSHLVK